MVELYRKVGLQEREKIVTELEFDEGQSVTEG